MFIPFSQEFQTHALPERFTFPFYYEVQPLAKQAAALLQARLLTEDFGHDFGLGRQERLGAIGKMFGVLVVQSASGELGYLAAFSGKLGNSNAHAGFVPPVFDLLEAQGFFRREEQEIHHLTLQLEELESSHELARLKNEELIFKQHWATRIQELQQKNKVAKALRDEKENKSMSQILIF